MKNKYTIINQTQNKEELKKLIEWFIRNYGSIRTTKLLDKIKSVGFKNSTLSGISIGINDLLVPESKNLLFKNSAIALKKNKTIYEKGKINKIQYLEKIIKIWSETNEKLKDEILKNFRESNMLNPLFIMTFSGARGNFSQIKQLVGMRGLMADSEGEIINLPIKNNFKEGLNLTEYFISCYGARKGIIDTALKTANSGYLTRRLIFVAQNQIIKQSDCKTVYKKTILNLKQNKEEYTRNKKHLIGRIIAKNIYIKNTKNLIIGENQDICPYILNKILNIQKIYIRSPLTCELNFGICQLCYGWNLGNGRMVELGESVGILAAQSIGEPGTQLTMRTFHTGGIFSGKIKKTINAPHEGKIIFLKKKEEKFGKNKFGEKVLLTKEPKILKIVENKLNISRILLPINSLIFVKPTQHVYYKQLIAEIQKEEQKKIKIEKNIKETVTPISGLLSISSQKRKNTLFITSHGVIEYKYFYKKYRKNFFLKTPHNIEISKKKEHFKKSESNFIKLKNSYLKIKFLNKTKKRNKKNSFFCYIIQMNITNEKELVINKKITEKYIKTKTRSLTIGKFKQNWLKKYSFLTIQKRRIKTFLLRKVWSDLTSNKSLIEKDKIALKKNNLLFYNDYEKEKTQDIIQGLPKIEQLLETRKTFNLEVLKNNPHEKLKSIFSKLEKKYPNNIAARMSLEKIQDHLLEKIQNVYESQNVHIASKHIELIIKQITNKVLIKEQGEIPILPGEIIELSKIEKLNQKIQEKALYEPILVGISKLALTSKSFIAAASFQETAKTLSKAAIEGRIDWLDGIKENIILNKLIPVGTGYKKYIYQQDEIK